jgi:hypothetical protein
MSRQLEILLTSAAQLLRGGRADRLMPALKVALGHAGNVGIVRLPEAHRRLVVAAHDACAAALASYDFLTDNLAFYLATRSSLQIAGLVEYAVTQVSVTSLPNRQG